MSKLPALALVARRTPTITDGAPQATKPKTGHNVTTKHGPRLCEHLQQHHGVHSQLILRYLTTAKFRSGQVRTVKQILPEEVIIRQQALMPTVDRSTYRIFGKPAVTLYAKKEYDLNVDLHRSRLLPTPSEINKIVIH